MMSCGCQIYVDGLSFYLVLSLQLNSSCIHSFHFFTYLLLVIFLITILSLMVLLYFVGSWLLWLDYYNIDTAFTVYK